MVVIPIENLSLIAAPAALVLLVLWKWSAGAKTSLYALARMVMQLCLIGYALTFIFETKQAALVLIVLSIMLCASSWIALRSAPERRAQLYLKALLSTFIVNASLLLLITKGVLQTKPWFNPSVVIPLAGMVFAAGMNAISLFVERYFAELPRTNECNARNIAYKATLIPIINSLMAVGLVSFRV